VALSSTLLAAEDACELEVRGAIPAAVLVALFERKGELHAVFTERRHDLSRHGGEISFPGGRPEEGDANLLETALREAHEEIGLDRSEVEIVGALQPTPTLVTGYAIYPFVGMIAPDQSLTPDPGEVEQILELSLAQVAAGYERRRVMRRGLPIRTDAYEVDGHIIWGATARIVTDLLDRLG